MNTSWDYVCESVKGTGYGDPHLTTMDGNNYTFNGVGEYTLLNIKIYLPRQDGSCWQQPRYLCKTFMFLLYDYCAFYTHIGQYSVTLSWRSVLLLIEVVKYECSHGEFQGFKWVQGVSPVWPNYVEPHSEIRVQ